MTVFYRAGGRRFSARQRSSYAGFCGPARKAFLAVIRIIGFAVNHPGAKCLLVKTAKEQPTWIADNTGTTHITTAVFSTIIGNVNGDNIAFFKPLGFSTRWPIYYLARAVRGTLTLRELHGHRLQMNGGLVAHGFPVWRSRQVDTKRSFRHLQTI